MASRIPAKGEVIRMVVEAKKPIHARELATKLGVSAANVPKLVAALDELAEQRRIKRLGGQRYSAELREVTQSEGWEGVLSLNPDFSQVENSITDISFNYNEKFRTDNRPFFQEGAAYFGKTPAYFYSNRIPGFDYGAKLFSRTAGYQLGALATRAPGQRTDAVLRLEREFDPTRSIAGMFVGSDRPGARGLNGIVSGKGREPSGLTYGFDGSLTRAQGYAGDGSFIQGAAGWQRDFWSTGLTANRYSADYAPVNALLASDLPGTRGIAAYSSYYRDIGDGPLRELTGSVVWHGRETGDGRLQRNYLYAGGSVELRREVKVSLSGTGGQYRAGVPVAAGAPESSRWSAAINRDLYWTLGLDLNTRNSRFAYGTAVSSGRVGGSDYRYGYAYAWVRPTPTTVLTLSAEQIRQLERTNQFVATWGWDITPRQGLYARYVRGTDNQYRLAYRLQVTESIDFFAVVDRQSEHDTQVSVKMLMTLP